MRLLSARQFQSLIAGAATLRADRHGPKVYATPDGRIVKLFRVKRWFSSSMLYPYALRFRRNSRRLRARGFACVAVDDVFYCHAVRRYGVVYQKLAGEPVEALIDRPGAAAERAFRDYAAFVARLHARQVYFRSLHPGNVLRLPSGDYGLIDVGDMRFPRRPLSPRRRIRNFVHLLRSAEFQRALRHQSVETFVEAYLEAAALGAETDARLRAGLGVGLLRALGSPVSRAPGSRRR
ncbi:MAG: toluene tolerance protein [Gammaproteobacteria bacterium]|nr:toluene tolerance protein [Gammaproteobacteria bacterium]